MDVVNIDINTFLFVVAFVGCSALFGFCTKQLALFLDSTLDYGKIFGLVRFKIVRSYAKRNGMIKEFDKESEGLLKNGNLETLLQGHNNLYWKVAEKDHSLQKWICVKCFSVRFFIAFYAFSYAVITVFTKAITVGLFNFLALSFCAFIISFSMHLKTK